MPYILIYFTKHITELKKIIIATSIFNKLILQSCKTQKNTHHTIAVGFLQFAHLSGHLYPKVNFIAVLKKKKEKASTYTPIIRMNDRENIKMACARIAYVSDNFELDVLGVSIAWAGFGFLFLVNDKVIEQALKSASRTNTR